MTLERTTVAGGVSSVARIHSAEAADQTLIHCALRNLVRGVPMCFVRHACEAESLYRRALTQTQDRIELVEAFRVFPRSVVVPGLHADQQMAVAYARRCTEHDALIVIAAHGHARDVLRQRVEVVQVCAACRCKIALVRKIRTLAKIDAADQLG